MAILNVTMPMPKRGDQLLFAGILTLVATVISLLMYSLLWKAGIVVDLPTLRLGFYSLCLWDENAGALRCYQFPELESLGVSQVLLAIARFGVYGALVVTLFALLLLVLARPNSNEDEWWYAAWFLGAASALLLLGLGFFLACMRQWVSSSLLGSVFLTLIAALALLSLLLLAMAIFPQKAEKGGRKHASWPCLNV